MTWWHLVLYFFPLKLCLYCNRHVGIILLFAHLILLYLYNTQYIGCVCVLVLMYMYAFIVSEGLGVVPEKLPTFLH